MVKQDLLLVILLPVVFVLGFLPDIVGYGFYAPTERAYVIATLRNGIAVGALALLALTGVVYCVFLWFGIDLDAVTDGEDEEDDEDDEETPDEDENMFPGDDERVSIFSLIFGEEPEEGVGDDDQVA